MKVLIIGGTGVFGSRLAELLHRDGHAVTLAGRSAGPAKLAAPLDTMPRLRLDRDGNLGPILDAGVEVVVDASGPFQAMQASLDDPWRVPRFCVGNGLHYLDLSDDADFTAGISALDAAARQAGSVILSGVSSVPALSSSAVAALRDGMTDLELVDIAILPGNRAPRGRSVVEAIMRQAGTPLKVWHGGEWVGTRNWSESKSIRLTDDFTRRGWMLRVPDTVLLPAWSGARSVRFRAGMELSLLNLGLVGLGLLRRLRLVRNIRRWQVSGALLFARLLAPFGSDRGGMVVSVTGHVNGQVLRRTWTLIAEAGEGPCVPTIPARTLLRQFDGCAPGARPCLAEFPLAEAEAAMADLSIRFRRDEALTPCLFEDALRQDWPRLPPRIRRLHAFRDGEVFTGTAQVTRGSGWLARMAAAFFGFPPAAREIPVRVSMQRRDGGERWVRQFGDRRFRSHLRPGGAGCVWERFGPFSFLIALGVSGEELHFPVIAGRFLGLPIPRFTLPHSESRESVLNDRFHFDVALHLPLTGQLMVRYRGWLVPEEAVSAGRHRTSRD
ncbi:MAG: DUF4166 domain-containing protein [Minwuia sp.]|nr:DUF4166 domain-containing protein [Minwuia sp.]